MWTRKQLAPLSLNVGSRKMNEPEAIRIAVRYLDENPLGHPEYEWELLDWTERDDDWLFPFCYRAKKDIPTEQWEQFGGAPAFVVSKTNGSVRVLSWDEYSEKQDQAFR